MQINLDLNQSQENLLEFFNQAKNNFNKFNFETKKLIQYKINELLPNNFDSVINEDSSFENWFNLSELNLKNLKTVSVTETEKQFCIKFDSYIFNNLINYLITIDTSINEAGMSFDLDSTTDNEIYLNKENCNLSVSDLSSIIRRNIFNNLYFVIKL